MANNELCSCTENSPRNNQIFSQTPCIFCNCDWESKIGRRIAVSLVLLEIKRFFLLALEMMIELSVLQFSGAIKSIILSFVDVALGIPCALAAISSIRKYIYNYFSKKNFNFISQQKYKKKKII